MSYSYALLGHPGEDSITSQSFTSLELCVPFRQLHAAMTEDSEYFRQQRHCVVCIIASWKVAMGKSGDVLHGIKISNIHPPVDSVHMTPSLYLTFCCKPILVYLEYPCE